jgi:uncharacterized protein
MEREAFLDSSFVFALELKSDQNHSRALSYWQRMSRTLPKLVLTSYIFDEVVTYFNSRNLHHKAVEVGNRLLSSSTVELVHVDEELFFKGWSFFQQRQDKTFSLTDCISFVAMRDRNIYSAFTFDHHFVQAGFKTVP